MEQERFQLLRDELFIKVSAASSTEEISEEFNSKFLSLLELCSLSLMNGTDSFFAYFFIKIRREVKFDIKTAIVTIFDGSYFTMYFNPAIFLECSLLEMQALIKHEIYHIISSHHTRARALKGKYSRLAIGLAMDISINQYIVNLPNWSNTFEVVRRSYDADLKEDQTMEQYAAVLQQALDKLKEDTEKKYDAEAYSSEGNYISREHDDMQCHELWEYYEQLDGELLKEAVKKLSMNADRGKVSESIDELLRDLNKKAEITWKDYLRRLLGTLPSGYKKTSTRRDRRQPDRFDMRGRLSKHIAQIAVAIDISGSISDSELEQVMGEILALVKNYPSDITVIECDSQIRRAYKVKAAKDIKKKVNTRGATKFSPVFEYIIENKMKNHVLVYFTDGLGEDELNVTPINKSTIWVLTGKGEELSLKKSFGVVKRLSQINKKEPEYTYAPNELKEFRNMEWSWF